MVGGTSVGKTGGRVGEPAGCVLAATCCSAARRNCRSTASHAGSRAAGHTGGGAPGHLMMPTARHPGCARQCRGRPMGSRSKGCSPAPAGGQGGRGWEGGVCGVGSGTKSWLQAPLQACRAWCQRLISQLCCSSPLPPPPPPPHPPTHPPTTRTCATNSGTPSGRLPTLGRCGGGRGGRRGGSRRLVGTHQRRCHAPCALRNSSSGMTSSWVPHPPARPPPTCSTHPRSPPTSLL